MTTTLIRPDGLEEATWTAIQDHVDRLKRARRDNDLGQMVGSAKDLVETVAKIVLDAQGETVASDTKLPQVLTRAHEVLGRRPGRGPAADPPVRDLAQGAKTIVAQLPDLRNRFGTGHGRILTPEVDEEIAFLCLDAAVLWSNWALRRLGHLLAGRPLSLIRALASDIFYSGTLRDRLQELDLPNLDPVDQRLVGLAVAHRAMTGTYVVAGDGVDACAAQPELTSWPAGYRAGLVEGLFLSREGYVDANGYGASTAAQIINPHPTAAEFLRELAAKINEASWSYKFANDPTERDKVVQAMQSNRVVLPDEPARQAWDQIIGRFQPEPPDPFI